MSEIHLVWMVLQIAWFVAGIVWFFKRNDELPLMISTFLLYVASFRFYALIQNWGQTVDIQSYGFQLMDYTSGVEALGLVTIGQSVLLIAYALFQRRSLPAVAPQLGDRMVLWLKPKLIMFACAAIPASVACRVIAGELSQTRSLAFEVSSYLYLFPLVLVSVVILMLLLWKSGAFATMLEKKIAFVIILISAFLTYSPYSRFQFLGWMIAGTVILVSDRSGVRRAYTMGIGILIALVLFAAAGALRSTSDYEPEGDLKQGTIDRFVSAEDANMLDGFTYLMQVYPEMLPFSYGKEHFEILLRPIPRAWWPEKPVGGYMNKLGLMTADSGGTTGISPTLFGSFYAEGGLQAILLIAAIYGAILGSIVSASAQWSPFAGLLVRAILCAWIIPLMRGGDLPNIYSWFGMAFWPCLLVLWFLRRELFRPDLQEEPASIAHAPHSPW